MSTHTDQHPYTRGGAARAWHLSALTARALSNATLGAALYLAIPNISMDLSSTQIMHEIADTDWTRALLIVIAGYIGLIAFKAAAWAADRQAWSTVPGAYGWWTSERDGDQDDAPPATTHLTTTWFIIRTAIDLAMGVALAFRGVIGATVIVTLAVGIVVLIGWLRIVNGKPSKNRGAILGLVPGGIIATVLLMSIGNGQQALVFAAILGVVAGLTASMLRFTLDGSDKRGSFLTFG